MKKEGRGIEHRKLKTRRRKSWSLLPVMVAQEGEEEEDFFWSEVRERASFLPFAVLFLPFLDIE